MGAEIKTRVLPTIRVRCRALLNNAEKLTAWERARAAEWRELSWGSDKQLEVLTGIERRVFGKGACD